MFTSCYCDRCPNSTRGCFLPSFQAVGNPGGIICFILIPGIEDFTLEHSGREIVDIARFNH